jgi:hypothetical protein
MVGLPLFMAYCHHEASTFKLSCTVVYLDRNAGINTSEFILRK